MKTVLITGAAKGIGAAAAEAFSAAGYKVMISYFNTLPQSEFEAYRLDLREPAAVNELAQKIACPDVIINNAGICQTKQIQDITDEDWRNMIDSDLSSAFYVIRAFAPKMIERKSGCIINVASIWGELGASCESHYAAAKAGMIALSRSLDQELSPSGIRVKCIAPGAVETDMLSGYSKEDREFIEAELGKIKSPAQIAQEILDLVSLGGIEPPIRL